MVNSYNKVFCQDDEKDSTFSASDSQEHNQDEQQDTIMVTKKERRGAAVGGAVAGMFLGGPILSVIAGYGAAMLTQQDNKAGKFCRENGDKVANAVIKGCDFIKAKIKGEDGDATGTEKQ